MQPPGVVHEIGWATSLRSVADIAKLTRFAASIDRDNSRKTFTNHFSA